MRRLRPSRAPATISTDSQPGDASSQNFHGGNHARDPWCSSSSGGAPGRWRSVSFTARASAPRAVRFAPVDQQGDERRVERFLDALVASDPPVTRRRALFRCRESVAPDVETQEAGSIVGKRVLGEQRQHVLVVLEQTPKEERQRPPRPEVGVDAVDVGKVKATRFVDVQVVEAWLVGGEEPGRLTERLDGTELVRKRLPFASIQAALDRQPYSVGWVLAEDAVGVGEEERRRGSKHQCASTGHAVLGFGCEQPSRVADGRLPLRLQHAEGVQGAAGHRDNRHGGTEHGRRVPNARASGTSRETGQTQHDAEELKRPEVAEQGDAHVQRGDHERGNLPRAPRDQDQKRDGHLDEQREEIEPLVHPQREVVVRVPGGSGRHGLPLVPVEDVREVAPAFVRRVEELVHAHAELQAEQQEVDREGDEHRRDAGRAELRHAVERRHEHREQRRLEQKEVPRVEERVPARNHRGKVQHVADQQCPASAHSHRRRERRQRSHPGHCRDERIRRIDPEQRRQPEVAVGRRELGPTRLDELRDGADPPGTDEAEHLRRLRQERHEVAERHASDEEPPHQEWVRPPRPPTSSHPAPLCAL